LKRALRTLSAFRKKKPSSAKKNRRPFCTSCFCSCAKARGTKVKKKQRELCPLRTKLPKILPFYYPCLQFKLLRTHFFSMGEVVRILGTREKAEVRSRAWGAKVTKLFCFS